MLQPKPSSKHSSSSMINLGRRIKIKIKYKTQGHTDLEEDTNTDSASSRVIERQSTEDTVSAPRTEATKQAHDHVQQQRCCLRYAVESCEGLTSCVEAMMAEQSSLGLQESRQASLELTALTVSQTRPVVPEV
jgi:hypothetical protein